MATVVAVVAMVVAVVATDVTCVVATVVTVLTSVVVILALSALASVVFSHGTQVAFNFSILPGFKQLTWYPPTSHALVPSFGFSSVCP